ncbi:MAG: transporter substrate-binding domain-containing protein [Mogibacterium sp.]|nr:transporter substrate-binding domain-containing protein [Mogibacterium sp.]MBQ3429785.1 transporter substrate-binding domain-containing protein [Mogibacterium sp.]
MKKKSLVLLLALAMIFTLVLSACGGGGGEAAPEEASGDSAAAAYDKILEGLNAEAVDTDEEIVVAMSPDFAPMEFVDLSRSGDDQYVGYDVLLAKYIANHLGKKLVIKPMSFDAVMTAVQTGNADMGISGFSWTAERAENYFITDWYEAGENETEQVVITTAENEGKLTDAASFEGLKVGAQGGSLQELLVKEQLPGAECVLMTDLNDLATALLTGKIDALAVAQGNGESFISANDGKLAQSGFQFEIDEKYKNNVVLINKDNAELGEQVNAIIAQQKADDVADAWYEASQMLGNIKTIDELGYDDQGNKITE